MKTLLIGAGQRRDKVVIVKEDEKNYLAFTPIEGEIVTLDINPDHHPDYLWDLNDRPLPFADNEFDEIHAYEVLEHVGRQGDYRSFFEEFAEYWRILKPGGRLIGTCPHHASEWAWGDPSHVRILTAGTFLFLSQAKYTELVGKTPMSDFRYLYKADFDIKARVNTGEGGLYFVLEAVKPSRINNSPPQSPPVPDTVC
jgi:SAM-dependent methyltransferase